LKEYLKFGLFWISFSFLSFLLELGVPTGFLWILLLFLVLGNLFEVPLKWYAFAIWLSHFLLANLFSMFGCCWWWCVSLVPQAYRSRLIAGF